METKMIFTGAYPERFQWNNIDFDLNNAVKDSILSEKHGDSFIIHTLYGQHGDTWQHYQCLTSVHPNGETSIWIFTSNSEHFFNMIQYCAVMYRMESKYRAPLDPRFASDFPSVEEVYGYSPEDQRDFMDRYFLGFAS